MPDGIVKPFRHSSTKWAKGGKGVAVRKQVKEWEQKEID